MGGKTEETKNSGRGMRRWEGEREGGRVRERMGGLYSAPRHGLIIN